jgi:hypothetical protein
MKSETSQRLQTDQPRPDQLFQQIWQGFEANFGALWLFSDEVSKHADQLDRTRIHEYAKEMADALGDDPQQVEQELLEFTPSLDELDVYPDFRQRPDVREAIQFFRESHFKTRVRKWAIENPQKAHKFSMVFSSYLAHPPVSGILLRRNVLVSLVGFLELFLENLLFGYYFYTDLGEDPKSDAHKEKARRKAEKENSPREGWRGRIEKFRQLDIDLSHIQVYVDELLEIAQRRNLIVHNDGVVDETYLKRAPAAYQPSGLQKGQFLLVSTRYLTRAFHVVVIFAVTLSQACWRQWHPNKNKKRADQLLERYLFTILKDGRYGLAVDLGTVSQQFSLPRFSSQIIKIHQAIAFRELGKKTEMMQVVNEFPEGNRDWRVPIALAILREDFPLAQQLLVQAAKKNKLIDISPFWSLFNPVKDESWFQRMFEHPNRGNLPPNR